VIAGSGMPSGEAKRVLQGFEVSGRWAYASGSNYATYYTANCKVDGQDEIRSIAVPANEVNIHHTWDSLGMRATGSHDFSVDSAFVECAYTFSLADKPLLNEAIFFCPLETLASLTFASVALGVTQHAIDAFIAFAEQKKLGEGHRCLIDELATQTMCQQAERLMSNNRDQLYDLSEQVWQVAEQSQNPSDALRNQVTLEVIELVQDCIKIVDGMKRYSGMMAVFTTSPFGRAWRDLHTLSQHVIVAPKLET